MLTAETLEPTARFRFLYSGWFSAASSVGSRTMVPAISTPMTRGKSEVGMPPELAPISSCVKCGTSQTHRIIRSTKFTPAYATLIRISVGETSGIGNSGVNSRTSGPPFFAKVMALVVDGMDMISCVEGMQVRVGLCWAPCRVDVAVYRDMEQFWIARLRMLITLSH
jgi:hypothetical protein